MLGDPAFINITEELKIILSDWKYFITYLSKHPTSVFQLVQDYPSYIGYTDACGLGAGGIWTSSIKSIHPVVWKFEWPQDIKNTVVSVDKPLGTLTCYSTQYLIVIE